MNFSKNPLVDIGIAVSLQDRFTSPAGKMMSGWKNMANQLNQYQRNLDLTFSSSIERGVKAVTGLYDAFQYSAGIRKTAFITNKMFKSSNDYTEALLKNAKELNARNPLNLEDIVSGQKFMAMAGMKYDTIAQAIEPAAQMAALFNQNLGGKGGTADLMTNIMATFNLMGDQANTVGDALSVGVTSANMSLQDLAQTVKYIGANAVQAGISLEEVIALTGVLGNRGIQGSMAGTSAGQSILQLMLGAAGRHKKASEALEKLGLSREDLMDSSGQLLRIDQILYKVGQRIQGLSQLEKQSIFFDLFSKRGMRAGYFLVEDIMKGDQSQYRNILKDISQNKGYLSKTMGEYMAETPEGAIKSLVSVWSNFRDTVGSEAGKIFVPLIRGITFVIRKMDEWIAHSSVLKGIIRFLTSGAIVGIIVNTVRFTVYHFKALTALVSNVSTQSRNMATSTMQVAAVSKEVTSQYLVQLRLLTQMAAIQSMQSGRGQMRAFQNSQLGIGYANGNLRYYHRRRGNRVVSDAVAERYLRRYGVIPGGIPSTGAGPTSGGAPVTTGGPMIVNGGGGGINGRGGISMIGTGIFKSLRTLTSGVLGFFGGPLGLAITGVLTFLPEITNIFRKYFSKKSEDVQYKTVDTVNKIYNQLRNGKFVEVDLRLKDTKVGGGGLTQKVDWEVSDVSEYNL